MKRENKGVLLILLLIIALFFINIFEASGASIDGGTNPGKTFEIASNWSGGTLPGTYDGTTFIANGSTMNVSGVVYLNGNLDLTNTYNTLKLADNTTFIIAGDLEISDKSIITIGNSSSLYIKGNMTTYDELVGNYSDRNRVVVNMDRYSNMVIQGDFNSQTGAELLFRPIKSTNNNNAPDFYVFGDWSGDAYTSINGLDSVEDEEEFGQNESQLNKVVVNTTSQLDNCALVVENGNTMLIEEGTILNVTSLVVEPGAHLQNYGTINFVNTCNDNALSNFNIIGNYYTSNGVDYSGSIINGSTGVINCATFNYKPTTGNGGNITFSNEGIINADSIYIHYDENILFRTSCNQIMNARSIYIEQDNGNQMDPLTLNGIYRAVNMKINSSQGHIPIEIGSDCGYSDLHITNLILNGNGSILNIHELTGVDNIVINTQTTLNVDGVLILGKITTNNYQTIKLNTLENSIMSLCYNPTKGDDNLDFYAQGVINGVVTYLGGEGLTEEELNDLGYTKIVYPSPYNEHWCPDGCEPEYITIYHIWEGEDTPVSEGDITLGSSGRIVPIKVSYASCLSTNPTVFLGIDDDPFIPKTKEIKSLYNTNPCSNEYEGVFYYIGGLKFRVINEELIFCEGDNVK